MNMNPSTVKNAAEQVRLTNRQMSRWLENNAFLQTNTQIAAGAAVNYPVYHIILSGGYGDLMHILSSAKATIIGRTFQEMLWGIQT